MLREEEKSRLPDARELEDVTCLLPSPGCLERLLLALDAVDSFEMEVA